MTGARIGYTLDTSQYSGAVSRLGGVLRTGAIKAIGVALLTETEHRFTTMTDPFGQKWKPLLPAYAAIKRGTGILQASGALVKELHMDVRGATVTIGSSKIYAAVHQFGATIKPVRAKALAFRLGGAVGPRGGKGSFLVRVQSVTIPQRPYLGFGPKDERAVMDVLRKEVERIFGA